MHPINEPFDGDYLLEQSIRGLQQRHGLVTAIETGTFHGQTTLALADVFPSVFTIEVDSELFFSNRALENYPHVQRYCGSTQRVLPEILKHAEQPVLFYLDAHWREEWPLRRELETIAYSRVTNPVIVIHDCLSPGTDLGYDTHDGQELNHEYIADLLAAVYGNSSKYTVSFNQEAAGARRGVLYAEPVQPARLLHPLRYTLLINVPDCLEERHEEYVSCLAENAQNEHIEEIIVFYEGRRALPHNSDKVSILPTTRRPTFQTFFDYANHHFPGRRCIVANADIIFDGTLSLLNTLDLEQRFVALTRWDEQLDGSLRFFDNVGSQDTWVFQTPIPIKNAFLYLGVLACDNVIMHSARASGLRVLNPAKQIITRHRHHSNLRTGQTTDYVSGHGQWTFAICHFSDLSATPESILDSDDGSIRGSQEDIGPRAAHSISHNSGPLEDQYVLLERHDSHGFFSHMMTNMDMMARALNDGLVPIVDQRVGMDLYRTAPGENVWERYFIQDPSTQHVLDCATRWRFEEPRYQFEYFPHTSAANLQQAFGRMFVSQHIRFQPAVWENLNRIKAENRWDPANTLGVFYRGTDKRCDGTPVPPMEAFLEPVERLLHGKSGVRLHLQTDDQRFIDFMLSRFPQATYIEEFQVSQDGKPIHFNSRKSPYELGMEATALMLLLSDCRFLVKSKSNVSDVATYFRRNGEGVVHVQ